MRPIGRERGGGIAQRERSLISRIALFFVDRITQKVWADFREILGIGK